MKARGWLVVVAVVAIAGIATFLLMAPRSSLTATASVSPRLSPVDAGNDSPAPVQGPTPVSSGYTPVPSPTRYTTQFVVPTTALIHEEARTSVEVDTPTFVRFRAWSGRPPVISVGRPYGFADPAAVLRFFKSRADDRCPGMARPVTATLGELRGHAFLCAPPEYLSNFDFRAFYPWSKAGRALGSNHDFDSIKGWYVATGKRGGGPDVLFFVTDIKRIPVVISLEDAFPGRRFQSTPVFPSSSKRPVDLLAWVPPPDAAFLRSVQVGE